MKIVIAGGSGFVGQKLTDTLLNEGHEIIILSRKESKVDGNIKYVKWLQEGTYPENEIISADAFVNLAGVSINEGRWTAEHRKQIYASRMEATDELLRIISALQTKPSVLVNASAIGIYPASEDNVYTEESQDYADDFLGQTVTDWEKKAASVESEGIRVVFMRFGVILGNEWWSIAAYGVAVQIICGRNCRFRQSVGILGPFRGCRTGNCICNRQ